MWLVLAREPKPDVPYWAGREWLALIDAVAWPLALAWAVSRIESGGIVGPVVIAFALLSAVRRAHRAVWLNHRYRFTTWRWGRVLFFVWLFGLLLKVLVAG